MKWIKLFIFFIILPGAFASWEQFQYDDENQGKADGTGYISSSSLTTIANTIDGTDFQHLVSDMDNDGRNEIIIFSFDNLTIFDEKLKLINETYAGIIQGQPAIYNFDNDSFKEIMFISNILNEAYFFAYEFDGTNFIQEFNLTINNGAIGSGIKCTDAKTIDLCIFIDSLWYPYLL